MRTLFKEHQSIYQYELHYTVQARDRFGQTSPVLAKPSYKHCNSRLNTDSHPKSAGVSDPGRDGRTPVELFHRFLEHRQLVPARAYRRPSSGGTEHGCRHSHLSVFRACCVCGEPSPAGWEKRVRFWQCDNSFALRAYSGISD